MMTNARKTIASVICSMLLVGCGGLVESKPQQTLEGYIAASKYDEAIVVARERVTRNASDFQAWDALGEAYYSKGLYDQSISAFQKVIALNPKHPSWTLNSYYYLGSSFLHKKDYDAAIGYFNKVLAEDPASLSALYERGIAHFHKGSFSEAKRDLDEALRYKERGAPSSVQNALRWKAFSYLGLGDPDTALRLIQQAKQAADYDETDDIGLIYYASGDKAKAWDYLGGRSAIGVGEIQQNEKGFIVRKIWDGSPAARAGLLPGDMIVKVDTKPARNVMEMIRLIRGHAPGESVQLTIVREGVEKNVHLVTESAEDSLESHPPPFLAPIFAKRRPAQPSAPEVARTFSESSRTEVPASDVDRVPAVQTARKKSAYAVVIGIEQYREKLPKADFADRDAKLVGEYLTKVMGYPDENVIVRTNDKASMNDLAKYNSRAGCPITLRKMAPSSFITQAMGLQIQRPAMPIWCPMTAIRPSWTRPAFPSNASMRRWINCRQKT